jgi:hypothetical protein
LSRKGAEKMIRNKTYIVYPEGALSWEEIFEMVTLLEFEGANPKIVNHNGFWNVQAQRKEEVSE